MAIKRPFLLALIFSAIWHFIWMISINVVVLPNNLLFMKNTDVSFFGSFLNEVFVEKGRDNQTVFFTKPGLISSHMLKLSKPDENLIALNNPQRYQNIIDERYFFTESKPFIKKNNPEYTFANENIARQEENKLIGEEARSRILFTKLPFPKYSKGYRDLEGVFEIDIDFLVTPNGEVYFPRIMRSSGYADIDRLAVDYVRRLKFNPLSLNQKQKDQRGIIRINISCDK